MTRVHAADGALLGEYSKERRLYLPIQAVPKLVINSFLAAEDKNFYEHGGIDYSGMARAAVLYAQNYGSNRRPQGASTITQQVAKNFLLTNEVSFTRKIKEALLAMRIERAYSKDKILELYLNEIYLGLGAYGVAAASLVYFDKSVNELTIAEAAYLAALPKAPAALHPVRNHDRAIERRNYVIDRLLENGWIKQADADKARKEPLTVTNRSNGAHIFAGEYFAEEVRRDVFERYGEKKLYEGGLSVRTTLDPKLQVMARKTMAAGLVNFDEAQGWRGASSKIDISGDWGVKLADIKSLSDISPWRMAVVLETSEQSARIGFQPGRELGGAVVKDRQTGNITLDGVKWAKPTAGPTKGRTPTAVSQVLAPGDVIYADPLVGKDGSWWTASTGCASCPRFRVRWWRWIPGPAACWRWSADSRSTSPSSIARRRPTGSRGRPSSRSCTRPPSITDIRPRPSWSMRRSKSIRGRAQASGARRTIRPANIMVRRRFATRCGCHSTP